MGKDLRKLMSSAPVPLCERPLYPVIRDCEGALILPGIAMRDGISQNKNQINETLSVITVTVSKREV